MRIEDIEYALAIARMGGVARAAQHIGISQPALSKSISRLEANVKTRLFDRSTKGMTLTEEGRIFLEHAGKAAMHASDARNALRDRRQGLTGLVRFGIGVGVPTGLITSACAKVSRPGGVRFEITSAHTDSLINALRAGELDLIVGGIPNPRDQELDWTPLWPDPMVPFVPRGMELASNLTDCTLESLHSVPWILSPRGTVARDHFDSTFVSAGLSAPLPIVESRSSGLDPYLALAMDALVLMPLSLLRDDRVKRSFLTLQSVPSLTLERTVSLISRRSTYISPTVAKFKKRIETGYSRWVVSWKNEELSVGLR